MIGWVVFFNIMPRYARITAYNYRALDVEGCSDFSLNQYWGNQYKNIFYLEGDLGRSTFDDTVETDVDITGSSIRIQNTSVARFNLTVAIASPLLNFLKTLDKHDVKTIEFLDTGDTYNIKNIDIEDNGSQFDTLEIVNIVFEDEPISKTSNDVFVLNSAKKAFWDNDNNGVADINGYARYQQSLDVFDTWQLYYESDGITPATSGNVMIFVYGESQSGIESLLGIFRGVFNDLFSDSTKWQSTLPIWDYFDTGDKVGHTKRVRFDKRAFATDNGFLSSEVDNRASKIRFDLSINGSVAQHTTQELVYTLWGAFHSAGVQSYLTGDYGVTTIGKTNQKNTLSTVIDTMRDVVTNATTTVTAPVLSAISAWYNTYVLNSVSGNEFFFSQNISTSGGYLGSNFRFSYGSDNFTLSLDESAPIQQSENLLAFVTGTTPFDFSFDWKYDRQSGGGGFPFAGDVSLTLPATVYFDGVLLNTLPTIIPATLQVLGSQSITLPDTEKHLIKIGVTPTGGLEIFTQFEVQLKPLF